MSILERLSVKPFAVVGHRGAAGVAPENTLKAVEAGIRAGADIVEVDVRATSDGRLVVFHDQDLKRLAGMDKRISTTTFQWLRENVRVGGEPIPLLEEVLELVNGRAGVFIEVKEPETTRRIMEVLESYKAASDVALISFYDEALAEAKKLNPRIVTGLIYAKPPGRILEARRLGVSIVLPQYHIATVKANSLAHRLGLKVVAWTINSVEDMARAYQAGVDAIATDYPDKAVELRENLARKTGRPS